MTDTSRLRRLSLRSVVNALPTGAVLPPRVWAFRHRVIRGLLFLHVPALLVFGVARGYAPFHVLLEVCVLAVAGLASNANRLSKVVRSAVATFGLVTASALTVHLSGGTIEAHFHFFVILGVISLYQHWMPLILALGYVVVHHGLIGYIAPGIVYNHADALAHPWRWAMIHGAFVLAASAVNVIAWRMNEVSREESATILNSMREGIFGFDEGGRITLVNPAAASMLGCSADGVERMDAHDLVHGSMEHSRSDCPLSSRVMPGTHMILDTFNTPRGPIEVEYSRTEIKRRGRSAGTVVTFRDIAERREADAALRNTLSLLSATLESTADGILVVNLQGRITSSNAKFAEMWGIPKDLVASGDDDRALSHVLTQLRDPEGFLARVRSLYENPSESSYDLLAFKDGRTFERFSQPQCVDGVPVGRVWSFRDITERSRLDEMKNAFLSAVSHELRTPLTGILGYAVTLNRTDIELDTPQRTYMASRLEACARKLERLLNDTIDLDRLSRGILAPLRSLTDLTTLTLRVVEDFESGGRPIVVDAKGRANVDGAKVERIVENLLLNAVKHTAPGTTIRVRMEMTGDGLLVTVEDDGDGVPDAQKAQIFSAFHRGSGSPQHAPGFGIGLALVARFAELHGGRAWVEDAPSGGAAFKVLLPETGPLDNANGKAVPLADAG